MRWLQVVPVLGRRLGRRVSEHLPLADGEGLINYERQRVISIRRFIVMNRTEPTVTDPAWCGHLPEAGPVFPAGVSVGYSNDTKKPNVFTNLGFEF